MTDDFEIKQMTQSFSQHSLDESDIQYKETNNTHQNLVENGEEFHPQRVVHHLETPN